MAVSMSILKQIQKPLLSQKNTPFRAGSDGKKVQLMISGILFLG